MKQDSIIDVLVPAYNTEKFIGKTIDSIRKQTYGFWRLIIVNDGSCDKTAEVCKKYASCDSRIIFIDRSNNLGIVKTRKELLSYVLNDYFMMVDSDDIVHPQTLEIFASIALKSNADIIYTREVQNFSRRLHIGLRFNRKSMDSIKYKKVDAGKAIYNFVGYPYYNVGLTSKLYSKKLAVVPLDTIPHLFVGDDICINMLWYSEADSVYEIDERLYYYRPGGSSNKYYSGLSKDVYNLYCFRKDYFKNNDNDNTLLKSNIIHVLYMLYSLCEGTELNMHEISKDIIPILDDAKRIDLESQIVDFWRKSIELDRIIPQKKRDTLFIELKKWVIYHL